MTTTWAFAGRHLMSDFRGVEPALLDDEPFLQTALTHALASAGATVCSMLTKQFEPWGLTLLALLSESHASMHTYPEHGALFIDIFTCGDAARPEVAITSLARALKPLTADTTTIARGGEQLRHASKETVCRPFANHLPTGSPGSGISIASSTTARPPFSAS
jgi:S-adenosylmethionine decarboxylase